METMDSYGGWIGAPVDYLRFILAIEGRRGTALLDAATLAQMNAPSRWQAAAADDEFRAKGTSYGLGIRVRQLKDGGLNLWHGGSVPGASTLAVRTADGFAWVAAFNGRPQNRAAFKGEIDRGLWIAKTKVWKWPAGDLFR